MAGSNPKTLLPKTRKISTRSSPCNCNSRLRGESGRMNVLLNPSAVLYVPAKSSTFSPCSPHKIAKKLHQSPSALTPPQDKHAKTHLLRAVSTALTINAPLVPGNLTNSILGGPNADALLSVTPVAVPVTGPPFLSPGNPPITILSPVASPPSPSSLAPGLFRLNAAVMMRGRNRCRGVLALLNELGALGVCWCWCRGVSAWCTLFARPGEWGSGLGV